jgi:hypothetical protein
MRYGGWSAYGESETADILFAVGVDQRRADDGIAAKSTMPGLIRKSASVISTRRGTGGSARNRRRMPVESPVALR